MGANTGQVIHIGCNTLIFKKGKLLLGKRKNCFGEGTWVPELFPPHKKIIEAYLKKIVYLR